MCKIFIFRSSIRSPKPLSLPLVACAIVAHTKSKEHTQDWLDCCRRSSAVREARERERESQSVRRRRLHHTHSPWEVTFFVKREKRSPLVTREASKIYQFTCQHQHTHWQSNKSAQVVFKTIHLSWILFTHWWTPEASHLLECTASWRHIQQQNTCYFPSLSLSLSFSYWAQCKSWSSFKRVTQDPQLIHPHREWVCIRSTSSLRPQLHSKCTAVTK